MMASLMIVRRKPKEAYSPLKKDTTETSDKRSECPIFSVHYLGKLPAKGEYGREFISEPVECLLKMKEKQRLPKTTLTVSEKGFHFLGQNGPFGKEKHVLIPLHNVCYGVADEQSPSVFAIITRTESNSDSSLFECHAFFCDKRKIASEITYWLLRTFLQVFEDLQKKRRLRQERKLLRRQQGGTREATRNLEPPREGRKSRNKSPYCADSRHEKPFEWGSYSVILEGSKSHGAAVGLTRSPSRSHRSNDESDHHRHIAHKNEAPLRGNGFDYNANVYERIPQETLINVDADVHNPSPQIHARPPSQVSDGRNTYVYSGGVTGGPQQIRNTDRNLAVPPQVQGPVTYNGRYTKNPSPQSPRRGAGSIAQSSHHDESDFLFIDLLQEEFTQGRQNHDDGFSVRSGRRGEAIGPPNQKLRSEDIERRIREWLSAREELGEDMSLLSGDEQKARSSPAVNRFRRQWSNGDTVSVASGEAYF